MKSRPRIWIIFSLYAALCILSLNSLRLEAQAVYGSIIGTALDATGALVANAKVTVRNIDQNVTTTATTNESGNFTVPQLVRAIMR